MQYNLSSKTIRFIALLITFIGFGLRIYQLGSESLWYDELLQVELSLHDIPTLLYRLPFHAALPLDYLLSHYWIYIATPDIQQRIPSDFWVRIPAVVAGTMTLPVAFQFGRRFVGQYHGLVLMAVFACHPFHIQYSQEVRPYVLGVLGVTLFAYLLWSVRATGKWRYLVPLPFASLIFSLAHFFATPIFGPLLIFFGLDALFGKKQNSHPYKALTGLLVSGLTVMLVLYALGWGQDLLRVSDNFAGTIVNPKQFTAEPDEKPDHGLGPIVTTDFIKTDILALLGAGTTPASLFLMNGLVILGAVGLARQSKGKQSLLLVLWVLVPVVTIVAFLVHRGTFFAPRYIIFILPAYLLLLTAGILALPQFLRRTGQLELAVVVFLIVAGVVFADLGQDVQRWYRDKNKEDWRLVSQFIRTHVGPNDAVIGVKAEPIVNWYYPPAQALGNTYDDLEVIKEKVASAERSWIILSIFSSGIDAPIKAWLSDSEQGSVRFALDPIISVYYLGHDADKEQLLEEVRDFALPVNHAIYASLGRDNRQHPEIARQYYLRAIETAPTEELKTRYEADLASLLR